MIVCFIQMQNRKIQTEEMMNSAFLGLSLAENMSAGLSERRASLPSMLNNPHVQPPGGDLPLPRARLPAISGTPDMEENRRQQNVAIVSAVVESDQEQHSKRSSPSQSSKTESAHANLDQTITGGKGPYPDDTDLGSKGDLSLDLDQHSDYDNQPASDMEVNLESEADVHGLDASGDELDGSAPRLASGIGIRDLDSSDSESDETGSSIGEEQALFQQLQSNPRIRALQANNANYSDRDSSGNLSWDEFQHEPSFAIDPRQYAFNPYALDNDIIANRYFHDANARLSSSQGKSLDEYDANLPYDPDPDATVV